MNKDYKLKKYLMINLLLTRSEVYLPQSKKRKMKMKWRTSRNPVLSAFAI